MGADQSRPTRSGARVVPGPRSTPHPDTRAQAAEAMVENWDEARRNVPGGRPVMITDASNKERDRINAMAQECRAEAGEFGSDRVELPGKRYGLAAGDEVIFTGQLQITGERRVENGIPGTVVDADRHSDRLTIETHERDPQEVEVDTSSSTISRSPTPSTSTRARASPPRPRHPDRRLADRQGERLCRPQPRPRADPDLRLAGGSRRGGYGHRRDPAARRAHAPQQCTGGEHRRGTERDRQAEREAGVERRTEQDRDLDRGFGIEYPATFARYFPPTSRARLDETFNARLASTVARASTARASRWRGRDVLFHYGTRPRRRGIEHRCFVCGTTSARGFGAMAPTSRRRIPRGRRGHSPLLRRRSDSA